MGALLSGAILAAALVARPAPAEPTGPKFVETDAGKSTTTSGRVMSGVSFGTVPDEQDPAPAQKRPVIIEYSDGYRTRAKIHKHASFAMAPLFVAEGVVGQSLYNNPTSGKRTAHLAVATGIGVLFGVNTVTGVWNMVEAKKDPHGRALRLTHGLLMLAADAGFFATALTGPGHRARNGSNFDSQRSLHRSLAFTSIGFASVGYTIMLFGRH